MAEGPQVRRRTEWLQRYVAGRRLIRCQSNRDDIDGGSLQGARIERAFCKGKHIFIEIEGGRFLHNHLLMRGRWRKLDGQQLFLPAGAWLGLYVGPYTICNLNGQKLKLVDSAEVERQLGSLGPDAMAEPFPADEIRKSLAAASAAISEALLDQTVLAGVGNIAKSELLYVAGIDPRIPACDLPVDQMGALLEAIHGVLWKSYHAGGRWECRIYQRQGQQCGQCGTTIRSMSLPPSKRATYFCPQCQRAEK